MGGTYLQLFSPWAAGTEQSQLSWTLRDLSFISQFTLIPNYTTWWQAEVCMNIEQPAQGYYKGLLGSLNLQPLGYKLSMLHVRLSCWMMQTLKERNKSSVFELQIWAFTLLLLSVARSFVYHADRSFGWTLKSFYSRKCR